ncbi:MAG: gfo/Idh/MocA family oxidoreductase [Candidatus Electrothrix sp. AR1]|nr:gfo/Idh/MocA family oxidoreductase [Candidatus Electrothrix sp. AR1]
MSDFKSLKLGFIGGGVNSAVGCTHQIASQMDRRWILKAGCFSRNTDINALTAEKWGVDQSRVYSDYKILLKKERELDAIVILTPTPIHHDMVTEALRLGYPVICEKALATSSQEASSICETLEEKKGFIAVTHNYTGYPMFREIVSFINRGKLGKIHQIQIEMPQEGFARVGSDRKKISPQSWRLADGEIPTISLDLGVHLQHIIYFLSKQNPCEVVGDQNSFGWFKDTVDDVMCLARYPDGLRSQMWYSKSALGHRNGLRLRVYGDKGSVEWFQMEPEKMIWNTIDGKRIIIDRSSLDVNIASQFRYNRFKAGHPAGFIEAFANLYCDIADQLIEYKKTGVFDYDWIYGAKQATKGLQCFEAIAKSSNENRWVKVAL